MTTAITTKDFFAQPIVRQKLVELLGKNAQSFATSVLQIVNSNDMLKNADPMTVFSAACMAATLNLPINSNLGFAYIVPFKNNKANRTEAQFQLGYKGFIQLAQRTGQFERIAASAVYQGQLIEADPLLGYKFDWKVPSNGNPIGYVAFFKLLNGFTAELYMSREDMEKHAKTYSQSYKNDKYNSSIWSKDFDGMAKKTVIKLLLSKQAPLSIDTPLATAVQADQAIIRDVDGQVFDYADNEPQAIAQQIPVSDAQMPQVLALTQSMSQQEIFERYDLTYEQAESVARQYEANHANQMQ